MFDAAPIPYLDEIRAEAQFRFGVPAPVPLILAQIKQESGFNPNARSPAGALGLLQFMPATAKWAGPASGYGIINPLDPVASIKAGVWYDRYLFDKVFYSSKCSKYGAALSSYNGGLGWHNSRQRWADNPDDFWNSVAYVNPGIQPAAQRENEHYPYAIIFKIQPDYATYGPLVCKEAM